MLSQKYTDIQIDTLSHIRDICLQNDCQSVWKCVSNQYKLLVIAHEESSKHGLLMGFDWPQSFEKIKQNLLRTTMSDGELISSSGEGDVLPSRLKILKSTELYCLLKQQFFTQCHKYLRHQKKLLKRMVQKVLIARELQNLHKRAME